MVAISKLKQLKEQEIHSTVWQNSVLLLVK